jgi:hypothetical protein
MRVWGQCSANPGPPDEPVRLAVEHARETAAEVLAPSLEARQQYMREYRRRREHAH